jgi:V/A-type H+-transporting ATPase subunit B
LPMVEGHIGCSLTEDPAHRTICGISSGGICAFNAAWHRPDAFGRVLSHCGSFTNIRGGHEYPFWVRSTKRKPIRVFLQSGEADADIILLGGMGLRYDDYLIFRRTFDEGGVLGRTIMFIHTAADPVVECLLVPDLCLAVGEQFALRGKRVLVLLTDMTSFADALKEIAITMEQVPSNRGYPGDLYTQMARRYEKAVDFEDAGSMTILACVTMPGGDVTHPVPDNTGYITEGQLYLRNRRIEPFGSLSRLKQSVNGKTRDDHRAIMDACIQLYAQCDNSREKQEMGFEVSPWDEKLLKYGDLFEKRIMDLRVNLPLFDAIDQCWEILAQCFEPQEVGIRRAICQNHWPIPVHEAATPAADESLEMDGKTGIEESNAEAQKKD